MTRSTRIALLIVMCSLAWASGARAQDAQPSAGVDKAGGEAERPWNKGITKEQRARAQVFFDAGNTYFERSSYAKALAEYRKAIELWDHPAIRFNMTVCLINLQQPVEAHEHLVASMAYGAAPLGDKLFRDATTYKNLLDGQLARLRVSVSQVGAQVTLDGEPLLVGPGEVTVTVQPRRHQIVARQDEMMTLTRDVIPEPGSETVVELEMIPVSEGVAMKRRWAVWKPYVVVGAGAVLGVVGYTFNHFAAKSYRKVDAEVKRQCDLRPAGCGSGGIPRSELSQSAQDAWDRGDLQNIAGISAYVTGGALVATGVALVYLNRLRPVHIDASGAPDQPSSAGERLGVTLLPVITTDETGVLGAVELTF